MEPFLLLLQNFLARNISPEEFVREYIKLWYRLQDEQDQLADRQIPDLKDREATIIKEHLAKKTSNDEFSDQFRALFQGVQGYTIPPFSKEAQILSHLFVEADAFNPDSATRRKCDIGEEELRKSVEDAFRELKEIDGKSGD